MSRAPSEISSGAPPCRYTAALGAALLLSVVLAAGCQDQAPTQPRAVSSGPRRIMCADGGYGCFCAIMGENWCPKPPVTPADTCQPFTDSARVAREDSVLADTAVQRVFKELADSTGWGKDLSERRERGGYLARKGTELRFFEYEYESLCLSAMLTPGYVRDSIVAQGYTVVALVHTHPTGGGTFQNPGNCLQPDPRTGTFEPARSEPGQTTLTFKRGPSPLDLAPWRQKDPSKRPTYPGYVLEPGRVTRYRADDRGKLQQTEYKTNQCVGGSK